ncbi:MAG: hypothetical protein FWG70_00480 [Oscillospiraceae bacterium]|nr:hypothetical protein [Oscillospiraceae bacterium]
MKLKKFTVALIALSLVASFSIFAGAADFNEEEAIARVEAERAEILADSSAWDNSKWLQLHDRAGDHSGIDFILETLLDEVEEKFGRADEGFYRFISVVDARHALFGGAKHKILTWGDETADFKRVRFTGYDRLDGLVAQVTYYNDRLPDDNQPTSGMIPAEFIRQAADHKHAMRIQTHDNDLADFYILEVIIEHYPDGEDGEKVEVYRLSEDPIIQAMHIGERFEGGSMGMMISGGASFLIIDKDNLDPPLYIPPEDGEEEPASDESGNDENNDEPIPAAETPAAEAPVAETPEAVAPAPTADAGSDSNEGSSGVLSTVLLIVGGLFVLIAIIGIIVKKKK